MLFGVTAFSIYKLYSFLSCVWFVERDVSSLGLFKTLRLTKQVTLINKLFLSLYSKIK